jgi:hypothetical protein
MLLAIAVSVHLVTIIVAVRGGLSAAEILGRTLQGHEGWLAFYASSRWPPGCMARSGCATSRPRRSAGAGAASTCAWLALGLATAAFGIRAAFGLYACMTDCARATTRPGSPSLVHRVSGLLLALFLPLHFWALGTPSPARRRSTASCAGPTTRWSRRPRRCWSCCSPRISPAGLRVMALEFLGWRRRQKDMVAASAGLALPPACCSCSSAARRPQRRLARHPAADLLRGPLRVPRAAGRLRLLQLGADPDQPWISIVPGAPASFKAVLPTLRRASEAFALSLRADDRWGNPSHLVRGRFRLKASAPVEGLPESFAWPEGARSHRIEGLRAAPGEVAVTLMDEAGKPLAETAPLRLVEHATTCPSGPTCTASRTRPSARIPRGGSRNMRATSPSSTPCATRATTSRSPPISGAT